jgi:polysaccharide biosynthesis transport protein
MTITNSNLAPMDAGEQGIGGIDINRLISAFRRRWLMLVSVTLVVLIGVAVFTFAQTPRYTATASIMINTRTSQVSGIQQVLSGLSGLSDESVLDTEVEVLRSRTLADRVVKALNLDNDPEFNDALRPASPLNNMLRGRLGAVRALFGKGPTPTTAPLGPQANALMSSEIHDGVVDEVLRHLIVRRSGTTYVINLSFISTNPAKAAAIANAYADRYLVEQMQAKYDASQAASRWLNQRLAELQPEVEQAEAAVQQYKAQHGLLASVGSSLTEQEISNLNTQLDQAKADLAEKDARMRTAQQEVQAGSTGDNLAGPLTSSTVSGLRTQQAEASSKVADLQTKYGPRHPEVQRAQRQLADINSQISAELARQVANLRSEYTIAAQRVASLQASLAGAKGTLVGNNAASVQLDDLQRRASASSTLYDSLLARAKQVSTDQGNEQADGRIVSHAKIPTGASSPNKLMNLALGLMVGLGGGVGGIFLLEMLGSGVNTTEEVERYFRLPHLGPVLMLDSNTKGKNAGIEASRYVADKPLSAFSEAFRNLRASIQFSKIDGPVKVVALTSAVPGEGKTTTTVCLGKSMAMSGAKVVIVDCDLRCGAVNRLLDVVPGAGLIEVLKGTADLDDVLIRDHASGAWVLPLAETVYSPLDVFGSEAMDRLLEELRRRFDIVLLDTAPVIPVSDTRILAAKADVVVLLAQWRKTPRRVIESAIASLNFVGADIAGIALTQVDAHELSKYGEGDAGFYYPAYRRYYVQ